MPEYSKIPGLAQNHGKQVPSLARIYTERFGLALNGVLDELKNCGEHQALSDQTRIVLFRVLSGGSEKVAQCDPETILSIVDKLKTIKSILESKDPESYLSRSLIIPLLQTLLEDLDQK